MIPARLYDACAIDCSLRGSSPATKGPRRWVGKSKDGVNQNKNSEHMSDMQLINKYSGRQQLNIDSDMQQINIDFEENVKC